MFVFLVLSMLYPNDTLTGFAKVTKAAKWYWRPLNSKRSLPVLKWTSEIVSFKKNLQTIYNPVQEQSLDSEFGCLIKVKGQLA